MKRNKEKYPIIKKHKPLLFWKPCSFCNLEFVREEGFSIERLSLDRKSTYITYCCNNCAKDLIDVEILLKKEKDDFLRKRPAPPTKLK